MPPYDVSVSILLTALGPSPVNNLGLCYTFNSTNQSALLKVEVQWKAPKWPEGEVIEYEVMVNSSVGIQLLTENVMVRVNAIND